MCIPHRPQTKGKVESGVKYLRNNFMQGIDKTKINSLDELNQKSNYIQSLNLPSGKRESMIC